jgi:ribosomal protein S18 acetylase RimI-like enzyme
MAMAFKAVRLRALQDMPTAFSSTFAEEVKLSDEEWAARAAQWSGAQSATYLAMDAGLACGIASGYFDSEDPARAHLASMWVAPAARRKGIGRMLVNAVIEWARGRGANSLQLIVTSNNERAIRFYQNLGFTMTDFKRLYRNDPAFTDSEMILTI